jgi:WD40 repeat protein
VWTTTAIPSALQKAPFNTVTKTVAFSRDGAVGAAWASRKLLVWNPRAGKTYPVIDTTVNTPRWLAVSSEAGVVAVADGARLEAWKFEGTGVMNVRDPHGIGGFRDPFFGAAGGPWLVTAGSDRWLKVWDLRTGKDERRWRLEQSPAGVAVSADGKTAVVWYEESGKVGLFALPDPKAKK